uniref:SAM domain-containing protein n=1 Tax=Labrus bergylta TaxID=56723 RepID=A0A3Q3F2U6_9LABR
ADWTATPSNYMYLQHKRDFYFLLNCFPDSPEDLPDYPLFISIGDWLDSIKMSQYKNNFLAAGYTTLDSISTMSIE